MGLLQLKLVRELLERNGISYEVSEHAAVYTSGAAAKVRGVALKTGVKALVLKTEKGSFVMGLVAADRKINLKKLAKVVEAKQVAAGFGGGGSEVNWLRSWLGASFRKLAWASHLFG